MNGGTLSIDGNITCIALDDTRNNFDQRTFARAVFPYQGVDAPRLAGEGRFCEGDCPTKAFGNILGLDERLGGVARLRIDHMRLLLCRLDLTVSAKKKPGRRETRPPG
jgi:hypothetical protein